MRCFVLLGTKIQKMQRDKTEKAATRKDGFFEYLCGFAVGLRRCATLRFWCACGQGGNRTPDTRIFSPLLYQLSYLTCVEGLVRGAKIRHSRRLLLTPNNSRFAQEPLVLLRRSSVAAQGGNANAVGQVLCTCSLAEEHPRAVAGCR